MKIVIAGAGDVGFHLAKMLSNEAQDIVLIDVNEDTLQFASSHLDVIAVKGSSTSVCVLEEANVKNADLLIAATSSEEVNLTTAFIGSRLGAKKTIARISNHEFITYRNQLNLNGLGIDYLIYPEELAAKEIVRLIQHSALSDEYEFSGGKLLLIGLVLEETSPIINKTMIETAHFNPNRNYIAVAIHRNTQTVIPRGNTKLLANDHIYFVTPPDEIDNIVKLTGKAKLYLDKVMIVGGSKIGKMVAQMLEKDHKVKLIETDKGKSIQLADTLSNTLVLHGDAHNVEFLKEEGIQDMDAFISLTGNSETNIISCLISKRHGVKKTIALVENIDYINLSHTMGIDTLINKKLIAASYIFRFIRKGQVKALTSVPGSDAEVLEFVVKEKSKITKNIVKDLSFPKGAIIGGVIRDNECFIVSSQTKIMSGDEVIVFALPEAISKVEEFFK